jgi:hypothetical protein
MELEPFVLYRIWKHLFDMFLARSIGKVHFEFSEEACNGIPGSIHCGIDASAENTLNYCCWFIAWNRAYRSFGGKCKVIFE